LDSSVFFDMFVLIDSELHTQFFKFSPLPFFMALEVLKEKSKKMTMQTKKEV
jgi:hypothetical protein